MMTEEDFGEYWLEWTMNNGDILGRFARGDINRVEAQDLMKANTLVFLKYETEYLKTIFVTKDEKSDG